MLIGRLRSRRKSHAETFWLGTVLGSLVGPILHFFLLRLGVSSASPGGALIAIAYSNADNWGGVLSSFLAAKRGKTTRQAIGEIRKNRFVVSNVIALLIMLLAVVLIRLAGFAPTSYFGTAVEGAILDNDSTLAVLIFLVWQKF